jgi:chorismate mutase
LSCNYGVIINRIDRPMPVMENGGAMAEPDLERIAADLESLEETIIAKLIDRAQFCRNRAAYRPGKSGFTGEAELSLFLLRLKYQEEMDARFGRFCVPEERPFNRGLPASQRTVTLPEHCLKIRDFDAVNLTADILASYLQRVPVICRPGDDGQHGSSVEHDVYAIQAIARRIHYGAMYVAESKYRAAPDTFQRAADQNDTEALMDLLTRPQVEARILRRVREKTAALQAPARTNTRHVIDPDTVCDYYADQIIPLTKTGEVRYLLKRIVD